MNSREAIKGAMSGAHFVMNTYLSDLTDAELLMRPVPQANHIAWQLGHLIASEHKFMEQVKPGISPKLPAEFAGRHGKDTAGVDDPKKFYTKKEYTDLYNAQRNASLHILETLSDTDLDKPGPESMRSYAPTIGAVMILLGNHELMHAGQVAVLRRKLDKPVLM